MLFLKRKKQWANSPFPRLRLQPTTEKEGYKNFFQDQTHACGKKEGGYGRINFPIRAFCVWCSPLPCTDSISNTLLSYLRGTLKRKVKNFPSFFFLWNHLFQDFILFPWAGKPVREKGAPPVALPKEEKGERERYIR